MFQANDAGLTAEINYRRERLAEVGSSPLARGTRLRRALRARRLSGPADRSAR